mgnify:CR=1 FL=1
MKMNQVYEILNTVTTEILGESVVVAEDLSNIVDVGKAFENLQDGFDNYVRTLHDHIGRMVFVDRVKPSRAPNIMRDGWEYGSILEKIRIEMPDAEENESWNLVDRASYDTQIFYAPKVHAKFWNDRITFEIPMSFTEKQIKSSFSNAVQLNAFYSAIQTAIMNAMTKNLDALIMRTINNMTAETIYSEYPTAQYSASSGVRAINLLYLYNQGYGQTLSAANAMTTPEFIRFASYYMGLTLDRMDDWNKLYNIGGTEKFTPADRRHFVLLSEFKRSAGVFLYDASNQFNTDDIKLPESETVNYWQGIGTSWGETTKLKVSTAQGHSVEISGILGVAFDEDACAVCNEDRRVKTDVNNKAEFWTERHKFDCGYCNDFDEQFVVFFVA